MDYSEFRKQYNVLMDKHYDINKQIVNLKKQYISSLPIKEGDVITLEGKQLRINIIRLLPSSSKLELVVSRVRKNGLVSKKCEHAWVSVEEIEKWKE